MAALIKPFSTLSLRASSSVLPALTRQASSAVASSSSTSASSSSSSGAALAALTGQSGSVSPHNPIPRRPDFPATYPGPTHKHINQPRLLDSPPASQFPDRIGENEEGRREDVSLAITGMSKDEMRGLRRYTVVLKRVVKMTKKGKMPSFMAMLVVGSPDRGLVGIGRGRGSTTIKAMDAGFHKAVQSLDFVNKYEGRTLWSSSGADLVSRWGATTVILRARPAGFGLMVPPVVHRVLTAAGIKDCSATIEGSRNPMQVLKATIQLLHSGNNPPGFGSGTGSKGRREDKGQGLRTKDDIERERGRYGIDIGRRL